LKVEKPKTKAFIAESSLKGSDASTHLGGFKLPLHEQGSHLKPPRVSKSAHLELEEFLFSLGVW